MKIGEIWQAKEYPYQYHQINRKPPDDLKIAVQVKITNIYEKDGIVNRGSIAKDKTYVSSVYVSPWNDGSHHADLSREHFLEQYYKIRDHE